ncbi:MAG: hypothetical protein MAG431_02350 [Chloroflexi bacterium]|nr:hypothetical protein [Chloroflexota bacterium]
MSGIICPIRGGQESMITIKHAIRHSQEHELPIHFLFVVDLGPMGLTESPAHNKLVTHEMEGLASFILLTAKIEADAAGVASEGCTRFGNLVEEITKLSEEKEADVIFLGKTKPGKKGKKASVSLASKIEAATEAKVILAEEIDNG